MSILKNLVVMGKNILTKDPLKEPLKSHYYLKVAWST